MKKKQGIQAVKAYLKSERLQDELVRLPPGWALGADGGAIEREQAFEDGKAALAYIWLVCRLAAAHGQPIQVRLAGPQVKVRLAGHPVRGCTGGLGKPVFNLAGMIG